MTDTLRLEGAVSYYGECRPWCEPSEDEPCTCGYLALLEKLDEIEGSTQQGEDD